MSATVDVFGNGRCSASSFDDPSLDPRDSPISLQQALGTWRSLEQFEGESRISFSFRQQGNQITGWAVMLGQKRKADTKATLALTFHGVTWDNGRLKFETMLPEDGGTIGWELRPTTPNRAMLVALTIDNEPIDDDDMRWEMSK